MLFDLPLLAVDIGSSSIKIVELTGKGERKLRTIGIDMLPDGVIADGIIHDMVSVEQTLRGLLKKLKIRARGRRACLSLSGSSTIVKKVHFPKTASPTELSNTVFYEAEQHFQHDIEDLYFDYFDLGSRTAADEVPVLLVGVKKDIVEQHIAAIKAAGLSVGVVDCDVTSLTNMFEYNYGHLDGLIALVNIGANITQVVLLGDGRYVYTRDIAIGGMTYTRNLSTKLGIEMDNAEAVKISASQGQEGVPPDVRQVISETNEQLVSEINVTFDYFFQSGEAPPEYSSIGAVFLCGGGSRVLGLDAAAAATLNVPINMVNPFHKIAIPKNFPMDQLLTQSYLYGVAAGLGLRSKDDQVQ